MRIQKLILALLFATCTTLFAQEEKTDVKSKSYFGLKAGFNIIKLTEHDDKSFSFGFQVGSTLTIPMSKRFSFQPEILLQTASGESKYVNTFSNGTIEQESKTKIALLLFPLNFKYTISKKVDIDLGPTIGLVLDRNEKIIETQNIDGVITVYEFTPQANPYIKNRETTVALAANLGTNYNFTEKVYLGFRYSLFISEFQNIDNTLDNSLFAFSLGYNFK